ncbi:MAG: energy transducer TonB [Alphaproteobacteria bacterium]|nr:energy transducer TonB [Alphaproteobacteria bacterium]MBU6471242.1 energy transducer TonB [Alphaproteobacteria bacterium]MDE2014079.1 energy transducer TonB [Alphaproteobacteria bacterium]MDE2073085.1 energy transducer TonB [Alphaproteobacteria bacterium]MDE2352114.1 energy transducer TonB [Alphaproteobacteria bacterium]
MVAIEFIVFVVSSGLFFNERFRHNLWAWIIAGGLATASSVLFFYHLAAMFMVHAPAEQPRQIVKVPVPEKINRTPRPSGSQDCKDDYPFWSRLWGQEGTTELAFKVLTDGTVSDVIVTKASGYERLDDAAVECASRWHYEPAIRNSVLTDVPWTATVVWALGPNEGQKNEPVPGAGVKPE